jgi:Transglutaminase-like superfamily
VRNLLRKFLRLPAPDRRLLLEAARLQAAVRLALWFFPVRTWHRPSACVGIPDTVSPARAAWAIAASARLIPRSTCLVRALAAQRLLARHGYPSTLHLGVAKSPEFQAHAWLEHDGSPVVGAPGPGRYTLLA